MSNPADAKPTDSARSYEQRLNADVWHALREGSMHFEKESAVHKTLDKMAKRLSELGVPYAIAGGMAAFFHGYRRFTEDVDILVTREGLKIIHDNLEGRGWLPPFAGSKNLRDTESGVRVEFLITGDYPGDGKPKEVAFPDPRDASVEIDGVRFLSVPRLIELKLLSGAVPGRLKDLGDVQELIRTLELPASMADELHPTVREAFMRLWNEVRQSPPHP